jgi:uncharacterized lipoprotein YddW (UPF0748 family)
MVSSARRCAPGPLSSAIAVLLVAALASVAVASSDDRPPGAASEVRALWVTRTSLTSPASIGAMVESAHASGFNTLLVQVRGRGDAYYTSRLEPRPHALSGRPTSFDPLAITLALAHERGLRVHAWVNVNLVSSGAELPSAATHLVYRHPEWLMVPRALAFDLARIDARSPEYIGRLARWTRARASDIEGLYASPVHHAAAEHVAQVVQDIVSNYDVDGLHLDYIRYPSPEFDYSRAALAAFRRHIDPDMTPAERLRFGMSDMAELVGATDRFPARWAEFRRSRLNALLMRVRTVAKRERPGLPVSAAVFPDAADAARLKMQDWRAWLDHRLLDVVCPMAYTPDASLFAQQITAIRQMPGPHAVWAGIGAYRLSSDQTVDKIRIARGLGADGVILFSYDSLARMPGSSTLSSIGRAVFVP